MRIPGRHAKHEPLPAPGRSWTTAGPRVLIEADDPALGWTYQSILGEQGYEAAVCWGPRIGRAECPLEHDGRCTLADGADVIWFAMALDDPRNQAVLEGHRRRPGTPLCVQASRRAGTDDVFSVAPGPMTSDQLRSRVAHMLSHPASASESGWKAVKSLRGSVGFGGIGIGRVRIAAPGKALDVQPGEVIVAAHTDDVSDEALGRASGLVVGSEEPPRAMHLPTVMGVAPALDLLREGDLLVVDAEQAKIHLLRMVGQDVA